MDYVPIIRLFSSYPRSLSQSMARIKFIRQQSIHTVYSYHDNTLHTVLNQSTFMAQVEIKLQIYHMSCPHTLDVTTIATFLVSIIFYLEKSTFTTYFI